MKKKKQTQKTQKPAETGDAGSNDPAKSTERKRKRTSSDKLRKVKALLAESRSEVDSLKREVEDLREEQIVTKKQSEDYLDTLQHIKADFDNFRKRVISEKERLNKYAKENVIKALLPVLDDLEMAIEHTTREKDEQFYDGVSMINRKFMDILRAEGVKEIDALDKPFDPHLHDAMITVPTPDKPAQTVVQIMRKGYMLHDRVIRHTMVGVSISPEPAEPGAENETEPVTVLIDEDSDTNLAGEIDRNIKASIENPNADDPENG